MAKIIRSYEDMVGQTNIIRFLKKSIDKETVQNVTCFYGEPGIGKTTCAKLYAIDIVCSKMKTEDKQAYIKSIIDENKNMPSIKMFDMSTLKTVEQIETVKNELNIGFSDSGKKVILMDEAHGMTKDAQDAILVELERLQEGVYVILCTTEIGVFREALRSRCKTLIHFNSLSTPEAHRLLREEINRKHLTFAGNINMIVSIIAEWCNNQPRQMYNMLENFENGSVVSMRDLEVFISSTSSSAMVELVKYLYGSMALGIEYISSLTIDPMFASSLIEVTKVALGINSSRINTEDTLYIKDFMKDKDINHLLRFTSEVAGLQDVIKRSVTASFIRNNIQFSSDKPTRDIEAARATDIQIMSETVDNTLSSLSLSKEVPKAMSLEEMFGKGVSVNE